MNIRFYNARILSMENDFSITHGELWVEKDRITFIGLEQEPDTQPVWDRQIDAEGNLLMPGFKNCHAHSPMTFLRSSADDLPLDQWLHQAVFPREAQLTPEHIYQLTKLAILEYLTSGITTSFDMYLHPEPIAKAAREMGFRTVLCGGLNNFTQSVPQLKRWYQTYQSLDDLVQFQLGFHAEYTTSYELMEELADLSRELQAPVWSHNSETEQEVLDCYQRYGKSPTKIMADLGMFDYGGGGFHCIYFNEEDMDIFQEKHLTAVLNPGSNLKLASGIAPIQEFLTRNIHLAIGTDGPASNNCLDMFREMFLVAGLAKVQSGLADSAPADKVLAMATKHGAMALNLKDCDCLAPGKKADLLLIDLHQPNMQPLNNIPKNLVYSGSKQNVKLTMIDGNILYENGIFHIKEDPEEIYAKANEIARSIK